MTVAVRAHRQRVVDVIVMSVVVCVRVLVTQRGVPVGMFVTLAEVQGDSGRDEDRRQREGQTRGNPLAERIGDGRTGEWRDGEQRCGARDAERALGQQIPAQARAETDRARCQQRHRRERRGQRFAGE